MDELFTLMRQLRDDRETRVVILTGGGKTFSIGADVDMLAHISGQYMPDQTRAEISKWRAVFDVLESLPQATIAAVNGAAFAAAWCWHWRVIFRIASSRAILVCQKSNWEWCWHSAARNA